MLRWVAVPYWILSRTLARWQAVFTSQRAVLLAGFAVIAAGIVCLYLSGAVARTGSWWQGTLDAFGVGFVVGGLIDVLAITGLNQVLTRDQRRQEANIQAQEILDSREYPLPWDRGDAAKKLLRQSGYLIDYPLRGRLEKIAAGSRAKPHRRWVRPAP
jgi:phosphotransferase system  glucose/maltose/N-acetylglucosamine-specific IIC component